MGINNNYGALEVTIDALSVGLGVITCIKFFEFSYMKCES
jgi:hypothetical protein